MKRALLLLTLTAATAAHAEIEHRGQWWWLAFTQGKLGPIARVYVEAQSRFGLTPSFRPDVVILRAALGAEVVEGLSLWLGFGWIPSWADASFDSVTTGEGRIYQQVQYQRSFGAFGLQLRLRFEERLVSSVRGPLFRPRLLVRGTWRFPDSRAFQLAAQDEVFVNLNERPGSSPAGFDQNRAYVGVGWWPTAALLLELGYQQQLLRRADPLALRLGHTLLLTTAYNF
ncbi:MAG: DUF2490 domain-containing protein [Archangiaceae bacterium]|nr:DUF2490 domain-containing protein [Archangiaceae bacterium]